MTLIFVSCILLIDQKEIPDGWRDRERFIPRMDNEDDKRKVIRTVTEKLLAFENKILRVLVVGPTGSGKSSFIDSIASVLCNEIVTDAVGIGSANEEHDTSKTEKFQLYCLPYMNDETEPRKSTVFLGDTPGFQEKDGITEDHVMFILNGNVPDKYRIISGIQETQENFKKEPTPGDKMHCLCLVFDCKNIRKGMSGLMITSMKTLIRIATDQGYPLMVILTKCDKESSLMNARKHLVFQDDVVRDCKDFIIKTFGFKQQHIFPVVNYVDDNELDGNKDSLLLAAFLNMLKIGKKKLQKIEEDAGQRN